MGRLKDAKSAATWATGGAGFSRPIEMPGMVRLAAQRNWGMFGRERELASLETAWRTVIERGSALSIVISGEPGVGRTRLISAAASEAHRAGAVILYGRCGEDTPVAYQPIAEALDQLAMVEREELADAIDRYASELGSFVPRIALNHAANDAKPRSNSSLKVLYAAITATLESVAKIAPLMLLIDDLDSADEATLGLLRHLAGSLDAPILLVATSSSDACGEALLGTLTTLGSRPGAVSIALSGLDPDDAVALAAAVGLPRDLEVSPDEAAVALIRETAGNPLFICELADQARIGRFSRRPSGDPSRFDSQPIAERIQATIKSRITALGPGAAEVLEAAAILGQSFDPSILEQVIDPAGWNGRALASLERARIIVPETDGHPMMCFEHALVRRYLLDAMSAKTTAELHFRAGQALERQGIAPSREMARHFFRATPVDPNRVARYCALAGRDALAARDSVTAARLLGRAVEHRDGNSEARAGIELLIDLGVAQRQAGMPAFRANLLEAGRLANGLGETELLIQAALENIRGPATATGTVDDERVSMLGMAERACGKKDGATKARLLSLMAHEMSFGGDRVEAELIARSAVVAARADANRRSLAQVLCNVYLPLWNPDTHQERIEIAAEAVALAGESDNPLLQFAATHWRLVSACQDGDLATARLDAATERRLGPLTGDATARWIAGYDEAHLAGLFGQLVEAERLAASAYEIAIESDQPDGLAFYASQLATLRYDDRGLAELAPTLERMLAEYPGLPAFRPLLVLALIDADRSEEARAHFAIDHGERFANLPNDPTRIVGLALNAIAAVELAEVAAAPILIELLAKYREQMVFSGITWWGSVSHHLANLTALAGDLDAAKSGLHEAINRYRRIEAPIWMARAELDLAALLGDHGPTSARAEANQLRDGAGLAAARLGAGAVERRAAALRLAPSQKLRRRTGSIASTESIAERIRDSKLSDREVEVLRLVHHGLTNRQIGDELEISHRTVQRHLERSYDKLGNRTRTGAASRIFGSTF